MSSRSIKSPNQQLLISYHPFNNTYRTLQPFIMMFTCKRCNKSETRLPSLPCGPCRKIVSRKPTTTRGATAAMMACLVLLSAPTGALASTTKTVVAGGRLTGLVTNKGLDNGNTIHMARLLEEEEDQLAAAIDVGTALSAAAAEGEQDHDEEEGEEHLHLFDEDHEDQMPLSI